MRLNCGCGNYFDVDVTFTINSQSDFKFYKMEIEDMNEEKRDFKSGVTSTRQTRLSLIPHAGLVNAAKRFELGLEKHGEKSWNNLSDNQTALQDRDWLIERCSHAIEHCYRLIDYLHKDFGMSENFDVAEGDAGAIAWCGLVLGEALNGRKKEAKMQAKSASSDSEFASGGLGRPQIALYVGETSGG